MDLLALNEQKTDECYIIQQQKQTMDIRDFEGLTKFKVIIPAMYVLSWISMFMGPSLFPVAYQKFTIACLFYTLYKIINVFLYMIVVTCKGYGQVGRAKKENDPEAYKDIANHTQEINYAYIIPNYKEEVELLSETLEVLASHKRAKGSYLVYLAMEAHEPGSQQKAKQLIERFKTYFRVIDFSHHEIQPNEQKGKASNVSWCAEHLHQSFEKHMINPDTVMLTIIDADSWVPDLYVDILEEKIIEEFGEHYTKIYQPNQIFTRNNLDVPILTRVYDILHSFAHTSNLYSIYDLTFPLSNYTVSYNLMKRIGFWDTCADAIGEDFHTTLKAYWKTHGEITTRPIYVPFNQVNISTGNGYWEDIKARFWQAERHAKGVADFAWCIKMLLNRPFKIKNLFLVYFVFQTCAITAFVPWVFISMNYQNKILYLYEKPSPQLYSEQSLSYIFTMMSVFGTLAYLMFEFNKRRANRLLYKQENESILRMVEYPILFMVIFFFMSVPAFVIAAFATLFGHQEYVVADKKQATKKDIHH